MKKQAENLTVEYDRLLEEHSKLLVTHTNTDKTQLWTRNKHSFDLQHLTSIT